MSRDHGKGVRMVMASGHKSTTDVAKKFKVTNQTVLNWQRGEGISIEKAEELAAFCDLTLDDYLKYSEQQ